MKKIIVIILILIIFSGLVFGVVSLLGANQKKPSISLPAEDKNYIRYLVSKGSITDEIVINGFIKGAEDCIETISIKKDTEILQSIGSIIKKNELLYRNNQIDYYSKYDCFVLSTTPTTIQLLNFEKTYINTKIAYRNLEKITNSKKILVNSKESNSIGKILFCGEELDENQNISVGFHYTGFFLINTPIQVYIIGNTKDDVFIVHQDALVYDSGNYYIQIKKENGSLSKVEVNVGLKDAEGYVEIESVQLYENMEVFNEMNFNSEGL